MFELVVLIPTADNDGEVFADEHHASFEAFVAGLFGGLTRLPGFATGVWMDDGRTYHDTLVAYVVAVDSITKGALVGDVVAFAKTHYRQEAIFIRYLGLAEVL